ncbi:ABC-2 type transport system permease protein [Ruminococcaceae bacterium FB2012]|nr:ABC-2 type transport system permease protein [Ruminococcaceae bacterium FB2012]
MNRAFAFSKRCFKEMIRDPLSYIFCLGFPLVMLVIMSLVNNSIPAESNVTTFRIENLTPAVAIFGQMFVMLFTSLTVSADRSGAFLMRLFATPMTGRDFSLGYILPMLVIAVLQSVITFIAGFIISLIVGSALNIGGMLVTLIVLLPSALMFVAIGFIFGTLFNEKAAPPLSSIIISLGSFMGGIWFDAEKTGGIMLTLCKCTPFFYCTKSARSAMALDFGAENFFIPLLIVTACAALLTAVSAAIFSRKMKA